MLFMQPAKYPSEPFATNMKSSRVHLFTMIQGGVFILLYAVKSIKSISIVFPIVIAACIPIRVFILPKIFSEEELVLLDSDDETVQKWLDTRAKENEVNCEESGKLMESKENTEKEEINPSNMKSLLPSRVMEVIEEDDNFVTDQSNKLNVNDDLNIRPKRYRRVKKSLSCPPQVLLDEARRQVSSNYFFG